MPADSNPTAESNLDSFVLRFVRTRESALSGQVLHGEIDGGQSIGWHGVIRHVQSNRERAFSRWADAVAFISKFVDVQEHGVQEHGVQEHGVQEPGDE
jgi:hypothetical protein